MYLSGNKKCQRIYFETFISLLLPVELIKQNNPLNAKTSANAGVFELYSLKENYLTKW
jgi:hypothetical protein